MSDIFQQRHTFPGVYTFIDVPAFGPILDDRNPVPVNPNAPPRTAFNISGTVTENGTKIAGAGIQFSGMGHVYTNGQGVYGLTVPRGYTGESVPDPRSGDSVTPIDRVYLGVQADVTGQDYVFVGTPPPPYVTKHFQISGTVHDQTHNGALMAGVPILFTGTGVVLTNTVGVYNLTVAEGYSGSAVPSFSTGTFDPPGYPYSVVEANQTNKNFNFYGTFVPPIPGDCPLPGPNISLSVAPPLVSPNFLVEDPVHHFVWVTDANSSAVLRYDEHYGTIVDNFTVGGDFCLRALYEPKYGKMWQFNNDGNVYVTDPVTLASAAVTHHPFANFHLLQTDGNGTLFSADYRNTTVGQVRVIDAAIQAVVAQYALPVFVDSLTWAANINRLVLLTGGLGGPRFTLFNPTTGSFVNSTMTNTTTFAYENWYDPTTGDMLASRDGNSGADIINISQGINAVSIGRLDARRLSGVTFDTCHSRIFITDDNFNLFEVTNDSSYTLIQDYNVGANDVMHSRYTNLVYYSNFNNQTLSSATATTSGTDIANLAWQTALSFDLTPQPVQQSMGGQPSPGGGFGRFSMTLAGDQNGLFGPGGFFDSCSGDSNVNFVNLGAPYSATITALYLAEADDGGATPPDQRANVSLFLDINGTTASVTWDSSAGTVASFLAVTGDIVYGLNSMEVTATANTGGNFLVAPATTYASLNGTVIVTPLHP